MQRWKELKKTNLTSEQQFLHRWKLRCEPHLEIKVHQTVGGMNNNLDLLLL